MTQDETKKPRHIVVKSPKYGIFKFIVDDEDFKYLNDIKWNLARHTDKHVYAQMSRKIDGKDKYFYMHRILVGAKPGQLVDHINRNTLDNRKSNLRICTGQENSMNRAKQTKLPFKGICMRDGAVYASIKARGKNYPLGRFCCMLSAAAAYDQEAIKLHGEFASLNFPRSVYE
jgi:hypothetical protein